MNAPVTHTNDVERYDALLLDYAAGNLAAGPAFVVAAHLALSPDAQRFVEGLDGVGGDLLSEVAPVGFTADAIVAAPLPPEAPARRDTVLSEVLSAPIKGAWRRTLPGMTERAIPGVDASLLRLKAGRRVPHHRHEGLELTLVLEGAFGDETGVYRRGALVVADEGLNHRPYVPGTEDCLCLTASEGRPVPTGPFMAWFVKTFS